MMELMRLGTEYFVNGYIGSLVYCLIIVLVASIIKKYLYRYFNRKIEKYGKAKSTTYTFAKNTSKGFINIIVIFLCLMEIKSLHRLGTTMLGASGILAVVLGLAAQESMSNFIGGFMLSFYKPFKVGDLISISEKNLVGTVDDIGLRHTVIKTFSDSMIVVPNSIMNSAIIENRNNDSFKYCNFIKISISYQSDIDRAIEIIQNIAMQHEECIDVRTKKEIKENVPKVKVLVTGLKEYYVELRASVYTKDVNIGFELECVLRKEIKEAFDKEGINLPYPTQLIYTKSNT